MNPPTRRETVRFRWAVYLAGVWTFLLTAAVSAQQPRVPIGMDTHAFRHVLKRAGLKPLSTLDDLAEDPKHSVLILLGKMEMGRIDILDSVKVTPFLEQGGAVLVATDSMKESHNVAREFGVIDRKSVV